MKKSYIQPQVDVTWLSTEAVICLSGNGENLQPGTFDPWASPTMTQDFSMLGF